MTDTLQALIEAGEEMAIDLNSILPYSTNAERWKKALKAYRANPPMTVQKAGSKGGQAGTPLQREAQRLSAQRTNAIKAKKKKAGKK